MPTVGERTPPNARINDATKGHSIFQTMGGTNLVKAVANVANPAVFDAVSKSRILPRGVLFEASTRMEVSRSLKATGIVKLSDNSGWAIIPRREELEMQYRSIHGGVAGAEVMSAYDEVGNAIVAEENNQDPTSFISVRVLNRGGLIVECPPPIAPILADEDNSTSPTSSNAGSSTSGAGSHYGVIPGPDSDVTSSVASSFLDTMLRTSAKKRSGDVETPAAKKPVIDSHTMNSVHIPCGVCLQIDKWEERETNSGSQVIRPVSFARSGIAFSSCGNH